MQTFHIKQKFWSLGGKFDIKDAFGSPRYQVEGSFLKIPKQFTVTDMSGCEISRITKKVFSFLPTFDVSMVNGQRFQIVKEFTFLKPRYRIDNFNMTVEGNFWEMNFKLYQASQLVAEISQEWFKMTSTYAVTVIDDEYTDMVISLVIAIDTIKENQASRNASS